MRQEYPEKIESLSENKLAYMVYESGLARLERTVTKLTVIVILLILMLFGSNLAWVIYENQFEEYEKIEIEADQEADNNSNNYIVGGDYYGEQTKDKNNDNKNESQERLK